MTYNIDGKYLGPDEDEKRPQLLGALQQLEYVREDADRESQVDGPGSEVKEPAEQLQGSQSVHLAQQYLRRKHMIEYSKTPRGVLTVQITPTKHIYVLQVNVFCEVRDRYFF